MALHHLLCRDVDCIILHKIGDLPLNQINRAQYSDLFVIHVFHKWNLLYDGYKS